VRKEWKMILYKREKGRSVLKEKYEREQEKNTLKEKTRESWDKRDFYKYCERTGVFYKKE
jgi:hypothetical protein